MSRFVSPVRFAPRTEAVGVVIPARNHAATISQCILSIFAANNYSGWRNPLWIVVVADACTDQTAKLARDTIGAFGEVLEVTARSLRTACRIGESTVLEHFRNQSRHALLLASADADTHVPHDWIEILKEPPGRIESIGGIDIVAAANDE
jgi:glycosyltransferase involved in cell wall biosynthesis